MLGGRSRQRGGGVGRQRIVDGYVGRESRGEEQDRHDHRARRAERIAPDEEADSAPSAFYVGACRSQFGTEIDRAHCVISRSEAIILF